MNNIFHLFIPLLGGFSLGIFYFGSLWITVRQLPSTQMPIRLFIGSYLGRMGIALLGFYMIMNGHWERSLIGLLGFLLARTVLVNHLRPKSMTLKFPTEE
jgi:F1F0 ATPase subunit 2